ncbi:glycosyltransferase family 4 protein [Pseudarthrobacter sp. R1]|uniref:glycosyltransferase family 4 protein n=1 Tax=Pseudarthrobacter sp. R1 TaxID=2944934 RepID=UPI0021099B2C|nr:glycosyltransferase family 4 protein [Pseudarthrobacter sp. R1]MCQ6271021.1 glycosyltransferase family 4 protein [Pseudarthrobacter sp. R1]
MLQSIRPRVIHGGSSKHLLAISSHLAGRGHQVTILCARAADNDKEYMTEEGVRIIPALPFRDSWVDTWYVKPASMARIVTLVREHASRSQRTIIFDSHFPFPDLLPDDVPLIWSLRDYTYMHALLGSTAFRRDVLVAPSQYIKQAFTDTMGGLLPGLAERVHVIPNGVDLSVDRIVRSSSAGPTLLFPHRPEAEKGFEDALKVTSRLVELGYSGTRLQLFRGVDAATRPEVASFYRDLHRSIESVGLSGHVNISDWAAPDEMPGHYAASHVTLCIGTIVEACSNTALESLACHTPVHAFAVGCYPELPGVAVTPIGELSSLVQRIIDEMEGRQPRDWPAIDRALRERHAMPVMLDAFADLIENAEVLPALAPGRQQPTRLKIPSWVSVQKEVLYDEYERRMIPDPKLRHVWESYGHDAFHASDDFRSLLKPLVRAGWLVPTY